MREANSHLEFDLDLAVEQSSQNPVYYVQYAHARICSLERHLKEQGLIGSEPVSAQALKRLTAPEEKELILFLGSYPEEVRASAKSMEPARITRYCLELAAGFHKFYNACRVNCEDEELRSARFALCLAVRQTLRNALVLLKIDAPVTM